MTETDTPESSPNTKCRLVGRISSPWNSFKAHNHDDLKGDFCNLTYKAFTQVLQRIASQATRQQNREADASNRNTWSSSHQSLRISKRKESWLILSTWTDLSHLYVGQSWLGRGKVGRSLHYVLVVMQNRSHFRRYTNLHEAKEGKKHLWRQIIL